MKICSIKTKKEKHKKELLQSRGTVKEWKENSCNIRETEDTKRRLWKSLAQIPDKLSESIDP